MGLTNGFKDNFIDFEEVLSRAFVRLSTCDGNMLKVSPKLKDQLKTLLKQTHLMGEWNMNPYKIDELFVKFKTTLLGIIIWIIDQWDTNESEWLTTPLYSLDMEFIPNPNHLPALKYAFSNAYNSFRDCLSNEQKSYLEASNWFQVML